VVHRLLAVRHQQGRHLCPRPAALGRNRVLPNRLGDAAPSAIGAGAAGQGPTSRRRRGRPDRGRG
jgi:hypothetical protein